MMQFTTIRGMYRPSDEYISGVNAFIRKSISVTNVATMTM